MNRQEAKAKGITRYIGKACITCGNTERHVRNHECTYCRSVAKSRAARAKRLTKGPVRVGRPRKYSELVGPVKPKKPHAPKPVTEFEKWVRRSRNNKKANLRRGLTYEMYLALYRTHCPLLGIELTYTNYVHGNTPDNYASLDRIDPKKGYVEGNVQILSFRANTLKGDATIEELKLLLDNWINQKIKVGT